MEGSEVSIEDSFVLSLIDHLKELESILSKTVPMDLDTVMGFRSATNCFFCEQPLHGDRVRDHDHINGKYRCAAHSICNMKYSKRCKFVPIFFHNLGGNITLLR